MHSHKYLLKKDKEDARDFRVSMTRLNPNIPPKMNLSTVTPPIWDQGPVGLCFSHAGCRIFDTEYYKQCQKFLIPSRLFLGVMARSDEGTLRQDAGATLRGTIKAMVKYGVPPEERYPYDVTKMYQLPPDNIIALAEKYQTLKYYSIANGDINTIKAAVFNGHAVMFGASIFESFESQEVARTGIVPMPKPGERNLGGHAMTVVGYDDEKQAFLIANSWGTTWGLRGFCWMPYAYFGSSTASPSLWKKFVRIMTFNIVKASVASYVFDAWVVSETELGN